MPSAAPYSQAVLDVVQHSFQPYAAVTAYVTGHSGGFPLAPTAVRLSYDARRAPYVQGSVTVALPDAATRSLLDPRNDVKLAVEAGYRVPGYGLDSHRLALLRAETVDRDIVGTTMTFQVRSDEAVVIDYPFDTAGSLAAVGDNKVTAIKAVVAACFPGSTLSWSVDPKVKDGQTFATAQASKYGEDRWEAVTDWAESMGARVRSDGAGSWLIDKPDTFAGSTVRAQLRTGPAGNVSQLVFGETRGERYATRLMLQYESRSGSTTTTTTIVAATSLTPPRMLTVKRRRPVEEGRGVARTLLRRALKRTHRVTLEAPAMYWLRPGQSITVTDPDRSQDRVLIDTVDFDVMAGVMRIVGRQPPTSAAAAVTIETYDETTT